MIVRFVDIGGIVDNHLDSRFSDNRYTVNDVVSRKSNTKKEVLVLS